MNRMSNRRGRGERSKYLQELGLELKGLDFDFGVEFSKVLQSANPFAVAGA